MVVVSILLIGFGATILATGIVTLIMSIGKRIGGED
jgi:hypothetical protein